MSTLLPCRYAVAAVAGSLRLACTEVVRCAGRVRRGRDAAAQLVLAESLVEMLWRVELLAELLVRVNLLAALLG